MSLETFSKLSAPAAVKLRQLQKMVDDMKKKEGSLLTRLKKLKSKPRPNVPARDYRDGGTESDDQLSEPDYDNDLCDEPLEDDSYEPPPPHRIFSSTSSGRFPTAEYIDSCRNPPGRPPKKPPRPAKPCRRLPAQPPLDDDYVDPDGNTDDDNYVEPAENPTHIIPSSHTDLPGSQSADFYEVPDSKENSSSSSSSSVSRLCQAPPVQPKPIPSPRLNIRTVSPVSRKTSHISRSTFRRSVSAILQVPEPPSDDEYEVCDPSDASSQDPAEAPPNPRLPKPPPRRKSPRAAPGPRLENRELPRTLVIQNLTSSSAATLPSGSAPLKPPPKLLTFDLKRPKFPVLQTASVKPPDRPVVGDKGSSDQDISRKPWFADGCDRRTADLLLSRSNKDGAFMVRKSSGQDAQQPYTLVVFYRQRVYNIPIRFLAHSRQFALGRQKTGEEFFSSVSHIVENHQRNPLVLIDSQSNAKDATKLCFPVRPENPQLF